jgi:hypothetical protein
VGWLPLTMSKVTRVLCFQPLRSGVVSEMCVGGLFAWDFLKNAKLSQQLPELL